MRNIIAIARREILSFFVSPIAYFVITGFILLAGYFFFNLVAIFNYAFAQYNSMPPMYRGAGPGPNLNQIVVEGFYHTLVVILVFLIPLLTMRTVAEEKKRGTFELLVTSPVSVSEIVLGKFMGVAFMILVMMLGVFCFPLLLCLYLDPEVAPIFTGIFALTMCSLAFASIGMAVSSFSENQVVAGICSMVTLLLLYVIHSPAEAMEGRAHDILYALSPVMQLKDFFNGVVTLKSTVYFFSLTFLGIFLSQRALESYRWR